MIKSYKTSFEMYQNMSNEHKKINDMSKEEKIKRCSNCKHLNENTFKHNYSDPCSRCIGCINHVVCVDEDYFEYINFC